MRPNAIREDEVTLKGARFQSQGLEIETRTAHQFTGTARCVLAILYIVFTPFQDTRIEITNVSRPVDRVRRSTLVGRLAPANLLVDDLDRVFGTHRRRELEYALGKPRTEVPGLSQGHDLRQRVSCPESRADSFVSHPTACPKEEVVSSCLVVQHVESEGTYVVGDTLSSAGVTVDTRRVFAGEPLPADISRFDGLVVMGGPMSANSDDGFPTRAGEIELLARALDRGILTLGICLGAQLLAKAAGGSVFAGTAGPEIGWGSVDLSATATSDPLLEALPSRLTVLHWHNDTFDLPQGVAQLASSQQYPNQAFRVGERAWGFQFHIEVDRQAVSAFLDAFGEEARDAGSEPLAIAAATGARLDELGPIRDRITTRFARLMSGFDRDLVELG